ncbi:DUF6252 family protein [Gaetbulibacter sp. NE]|uniref:DUF6252 family protein n=1 Tax=Gaetbulibacter sp. NE TaxID=2982307 RepID=UPI0021D09A20|nr:DUF6252 family protein [Gaetbulibacter sp. NE]
MKDLRKFMVLIMVTAMVGLTSCSSDDDGGSGGSASPGTLTAKIDGATMTSVEIATFATLNSGTLQIQGNTGGTSSKAIVLTIIGYDGVGTYPLGGGANIFNVAAYQETNVDLNDPTNPEIIIWQAPYDDMQVGEINISEVTETNIKGTFSFSAKNSTDDSIKDVTEGSFNIDF